MNHSSADTRPPEFSWGWTQAGALATVAVLGAFAGRLSTPLPPLPAPPALLAVEAGRVLARGEIERALSRQASGAPAAGPAAVQLSFVDTRGDYCRTFTTLAQAGLACREGPDWAVHLLVDAPTSPTGQPSSALPPAVVAEVERRIVGAALDAKAEAQALERGWEK